MADYDFALPSLGADMERATLLEWRIAPGDEVSRGDIVAIIETEKSEIDLEIWHGGIVEKLLVEEGQDVPVGTVLARLRGVSDLPSGSIQEEKSQPQAEQLTGPGTDDAAPLLRAAHSGEGNASRVHSPLVRHLAEQAGLDLGRIEGSGVGGSVTRSDVEKAIAEAGSSQALTRSTDQVLASPLARRLALEQGLDLSNVVGSGPSGAVLAADLEEMQPQRTITGEETRRQLMRRTVASLMSRSKREIPHYYLAQDIDVDVATKWLADFNSGQEPGRRILFGAVLLRAAALAAKKHPELNGFWLSDGFVPSDHVHLGVAVALRGGGLVAPALLEAENKPLVRLMDELRDLVNRTRSGRLRGAEMSSPTITVTSLGDRGPDLVHGIIYPPQVALIGFGRVSERVSVVDHKAAVRSMVTATLSGDHRATDGDRGARLLNTVDQLLQTPEKL